jgi:hypothetical protein
MKRSKAKENQFFEQLEKIPNISLACEKVGLSRNTVYRWCNEDPNFKVRLDEAITSGVESVSDLAESKLVSLMNKESFPAIKYWLDNHKKEYSRPRPKDFWETIRGDQQVSKIIIETVKANGVQDTTTP